MFDSKEEAFVAGYKKAVQHSWYRTEYQIRKEYEKEVCEHEWSEWAESLFGDSRHCEKCGQREIR